MAGGLAVRANLLCVTWSSGRGHVFLFDLEARRPMSSWTLPAPPAGYSDAGGVAIDERFHLFVADPHNGVVRHFSAFGVHLGDIGTAAGPGEVARDRTGALDRPHAVACHGDVLFVACGERPLRRGVQRFRRDGGVLRPLPAAGDPEQTFGAPRGVFADGAGILVADTLCGRVQRFRADGAFLAAFAVGEVGAVARPVAVVRACGGAIVVADAGDRPGVRLFLPDGAPAGTGDLEGCEGVLALARDDQERLYVLDRGGERVQRFRADLRFDTVVVDLAEHLDDYEPRS
jgi:hypothetical protein